MPITRNPIDKQEVQNTGVIRKTDPYASTRRSIKVQEAQSEYEKTGDFSKLDKTTAKVQEKTLGGSAERFNISQTRESQKDTEFSRQVKEAQKAYDEAPTSDNAQKLKDVLASGNKRYDEKSSVGMDISTAIRNVDIKDQDRLLYDAETNWVNDPEVYKDEYKAALEKQVSFYGADSVEGISLRQKLRTVDEESLTNAVRNAKLDYDKDPVNNFDRLMSAQKKLADFYGSSEDGFYAKQALNQISDEEQVRLDNNASIDFETGKIGYDGYLSYLTASMSKYDEGSEGYMKYYQASEGLKFNKSMDDLIRLQYSQPPGQVQKSMEDFQKQFEPGSTAYQTVQDNVDKLEEMIRYNAYQDMVKKVVKDRQEDINSLNVKLYTLEQDYLSGEISKSKYESKYKSYSNKIDYLSDSNTLPQFEIWKTYK